MAFIVLKIRVRVSKPTFRTFLMFRVTVRVFLGYEVALICMQRYESKFHLKDDIDHPPLQAALF